MWHLILHAVLCANYQKYKIFYLAFIEYKAVVSLLTCIWVACCFHRHADAPSTHDTHTHTHTPHTGRWQAGSSYQDSSQLIVVPAPPGHVTHCSLWRLNSNSMSGGVWLAGGSRARARPANSATLTAAPRSDSYWHNYCGGHGGSGELNERVISARPAPPLTTKEQ